jgi:hypothetical protein
MLNKTMIAVAAGVIFSSASTAIAYEDPENKIGDRYPLLEQRYEPISGNRSAARQATSRRAATTRTATPSGELITGSISARPNVSPRPIPIE